MDLLDVMMKLSESLRYKKIIKPLSFVLKSLQTAFTFRQHYVKNIVLVHANVTKLSGLCLCMLLADKLDHTEKSNKNRGGGCC